MNDHSDFIDFFLFPAAITACFFALNLTGVATVPAFEFIPIMLSLIGTMMLKRENAWGQIVLFASQIFFLFYFIQLDLPGQFIFSAIWAVFNLIGFYFWRRPKTERIVAPSFMHPHWAMLIFAGFAVIVFCKWRSGIVGILDFTVLYLGLVGQIVLIKKKVDGWLIWSIVSIGGIVLFWLSASYLMVLRSAMYLMINAAAFIQWRRAARGDETIAAVRTNGKPARSAKKTTARRRKQKSTGKKSE